MIPPTSAAAATVPASSKERPTPAVTASKDWWCCTTATTSSLGKERAIEIQRISGYDDDKQVNLHKLSQDLATAITTTAARKEDKASQQQQQQQQQILDLTKAPDWMEFIELLEHRRDQEGGAGAYDTLRCDLQLCPTTIPKWRIWGQDFHLQRLQKSYRSLVHVKNETTASLSPKDGKEDEGETLQERIQQATDESERMLQALLQEAEQAPMLLQAPVTDTTTGDVWIQIVRLTLLWSHGAGDDCAIVVRGHACCSARYPVSIQSPIEPIVCTVAAEAGNDSSSNATVDVSLPSRFGNPQSKVAAWTRLRKTMENPERYKRAGVSEVLMVRSTDNGDLELLEGLSSNLFVVYRDGTIRTATDGVLYGYLRQLVLKCAGTCGITVDPRPILLHEAPEWKEAFITSSSRLIFPISKILMQHEGDPVFREYWRDPFLTQDDDGVVAQVDDYKPKWQELLDEILRRGGYSRN